MKNKAMTTKTANQVKILLKEHVSSYAEDAVEELAYTLGEDFAQALGLRLQRDFLAHAQSKHKAVAQIADGLDKGVKGEALEDLLEEAVNSALNMDAVLAKVRKDLIGALRRK